MHVGNEPMHEGEHGPPGDAAPVHPGIDPRGRIHRHKLPQDDPRRVAWVARIRNAYRLGGFDGSSSAIWRQLNIMRAGSEGVVSEYNAETLVSDVAWPAGTAEGPQGIVEASKAVGRATLGELHKLVFSAQAYKLHHKLGNMPTRMAAVRAVLEKNLGGAEASAPPQTADVARVVAAPKLSDVPQISTAGIRAGRLVGLYRTFNQTLMHFAAGKDAYEVEQACQLPHGVIKKWRQKYPEFDKHLTALGVNSGAVTREQADFRSAPASTPESRPAADSAAPPATDARPPRDRISTSVRKMMNAGTVADAPEPAAKLERHARKKADTAELPGEPDLTADEHARAVVADLLAKAKYFFDAADTIARLYGIEVAAHA